MLSSFSRLAPHHPLHLCWPFGICWSSTSELNVLNISWGCAVIHGRRGWVLSDYSQTCFSLFLQNVVSKSAIQFKGNSQHDAQEFLLWLLDRVHEDLNHIVHPDIRPQKVNSNLQHKYLQYFICAWIVSLCRGHNFILVCHMFFTLFSFFQPPVEEQNAPEGSPLPAPGSLVQELFQAQYRYILHHLLLRICFCTKVSFVFKTYITFNTPIWWYFWWFFLCVCNLSLR